MTEETETKKDEKFAKFVQESVRGPKQGIYEHLLCQTLVAAVGSEPLKKIRLTCEAAMMVEDLQQIGIDKNEVDLIYQVALGFKNTSHYQLHGAFWCYMAWPFTSTKENFDKYIKVWIQEYGLHFFRLRPGVNYDPEQVDEAIEKIDEALSKLEYWDFFFVATKKHHLSEISYNALLSQFTNWALPKTQLMFSKLAKLINPNLYQEILKTYSQTQKEPKTESTRGPEL